jgi:hypothetical protein
MSHAASTMSRAVHFADNFPKLWRLKQLLPAPKRLLGAAGATLLKALNMQAQAVDELLSDSNAATLQTFRMELGYY